MKKLSVAIFFLIPPLLSFLLYFFSKYEHRDQGVEYAKNLYYEKVCFSFRYKECQDVISDNKYNIILIGNSQLTATNDLKKGDLSVCARLIQNFENLNFYNFKCYSLPNINPEEINFIFKNYLNEIDNPTKIIISLFYDDFAREKGVRKSLIDNISLSSATNDNLVSTKRNLFNEIIKKNKSIIESNLVLIRNYIFNINEFSIRRKIPNIYFNNMKYFQLTIDFLKNNNDIEIILYFPPLRSDYSLPFDINEYQFFKNEITSLLNNKNMKLYDFENYVDSKYFGKDLNNRVDFIHLKNKGHEILANEIFKIINDF